MPDAHRSVHVRALTYASEMAIDQSGNVVAAGEQHPDDVGARDEQIVLRSLSPSRAADFKSCPLLYRFRTIDRLPEQPSAVATRGTVVHSVLEQLFDLSPTERTPERAIELLIPSWAQLLTQQPMLAELFGEDADGSDLSAWLESARALLRTYFTLEDPRGFTPAGREQLVQMTLDSGLRLRGYIDRVDQAADGQVRIVDYKTGASPREAFEAKALFQMKFYALLWWRTTGTIPAVLKLIYLADADELRYSPQEAELQSLERQLSALWSAVELSIERKQFTPHPSRLCDWCDFKAYCPEFGGELPPFPTKTIQNAASPEQDAPPA